MLVLYVQLHFYEKGVFHRQKKPEAGLLSRRRSFGEPIHIQMSTKDIISTGGKFVLLIAY